MRLLRVLHLARVAPRLGGHVLVAVQLAGLRASRLQRRLRQCRRVGTHVGDVAVLVQSLRGAHRLLRGPAQLATGLLLQRRGHERSRRPPPVWLLVDPRNLELDTVEARDESAGARFVEMQYVRAGQAGIGVEVAPDRDADIVDRLQIGLERRRLAGIVRLQASSENTGDRPVVRGFELHSKSFALHDDARSDGLHASGRQALANLAPQHRGDLVAIQPVENATGLLSLDHVVVQLASVRDRLTDCLWRDFVEDHAVHGHLRLEQLDQVPRDGLALAVLVSGEVESVGLLQQVLELCDLRLLVGSDDVDRREAVVRVDS